MHNIGRIVSQKASNFKTAVFATDQRFLIVLMHESSSQEISLFNIVIPSTFS